MCTCAQLRGSVPTNSRESVKHLGSVRRDGLDMVLAKRRGWHKPTLQGKCIPQKSQLLTLHRKTGIAFQVGSASCKASITTTTKQGARYSGSPCRPFFSPSWHLYPSWLPCIVEQKNLTVFLSAMASLLGMSTP